MHRDWGLRDQGARYARQRLSAAGGACGLPAIAKRHQACSLYARPGNLTSWSFGGICRTACSPVLRRCRPSEGDLGRDPQSVRQPIGICDGPCLPRVAGQATTLGKTRPDAEAGPVVRSIATVALRSSAGQRAGASVVAKAVASSVARPGRKRSSAGALADACLWANASVPAALGRLLSLLTDRQNGRHATPPRRHLCDRAISDLCFPFDRKRPLPRLRPRSAGIRRPLASRGGVT